MAPGSKGCISLKSQGCHFVTARLSRGGAAVGLVEGGAESKLPPDTK